MLKAMIRNYILYPDIHKADYQEKVMQAAYSLPPKELHELLTQIPCPHARAISRKEDIRNYYGMKMLSSFLHGERNFDVGEINRIISGMEHTALVDVFMSFQNKRQEPTVEVVEVTDPVTRYKKAKVELFSLLPRDFIDLMRVKIMDADWYDIRKQYCAALVDSLITGEFMATAEDINMLIDFAGDMLMTGLVTPYPKAWVEENCSPLLRFHPKKGTKPVNIPEYLSAAMNFEEIAKLPLTEFLYEMKQCSKTVAWNELRDKYVTRYIGQAIQQGRKLNALEAQSIQQIIPPRKLSEMLGKYPVEDVRTYLPQLVADHPKAKAKDIHLKEEFWAEFHASGAGLFSGPFATYNEAERKIRDCIGAYDWAEIHKRFVGEAQS